MAFSAQTDKMIRTLHTAKGRKEAGLFIAEGVRTVITLLESNYTLKQLYIAETQASLASHLSQSIPFELISEHQMEKISASSTPSGILGIFTIPENPDPTYLTSGLVLAQIADPGNMGTLIRSAVAFGARSVVIVEGCDPYAPKVVQSTAGTLATVHLFRWSWEMLMKYKKDLLICGMVVRGGKAPDELALKKSLLVVGNEAHGLSDIWQKECDTLLTLPMAEEVESLNAAVAGSIALYLGSLQ